MLTYIVIFVLGFVLGGMFVNFGIRRAMIRELSKPPLSAAEREERVRQSLAQLKTQIRGKGE